SPKCTQLRLACSSSARGWFWPGSSFPKMLRAGISKTIVMANEAWKMKDHPQPVFTDYDRFAWFYNKYWGNEFSRPALSLYNSLLYPHLPDRCRILDLCCGTGQIARGLANRGFQVTVIDGSEAMLKFARQNAPAVDFIHADARHFSLPEKFKAVISAFDSLNHVMQLEELKMVFRNVYEALEGEGIFLFDLNLEDENEAVGNSISMV